MNRTWLKVYSILPRSNEAKIKNFIRAASFLSRPVDLHKKNWKENIVYLYQFKRAAIAPNLSPFCLKVETFLRANNIPYQAMPTFTLRSKEGKLPFIELNGQQIADSQFILFHLLKHFNIHESLSPEQRALGRSVDRMIEGSTHPALMYFRNYENAHNLLNPNISGMPIPSFIVNLLFVNRFKAMTIKRLKTEGTGQRPRQAIIEILRRDIEAIDGILGDKKFIMGMAPTTPDFTTFAHLATSYYMPFRQPVTDIIDDGFPRIQSYLDRIRTHYWQDWKKPTSK